MKKQLKLDTKITKKTKFFLTILAILIPLLILSIVTIKNRIHDAKIDLLISPASSLIKIDGKEYKNGKHDISSGKHTIELSKDGFDFKKEEIEIKTGETHIYYNYLQELNSSTEWYKTHEEDSLLLETIIPALSDKHLKSLQEKYPLIQHLPINISEYNKTYTKYTNYSISYTIEDDLIQIIITDISGDNYKTALEKIKSLGYNPKDYKIQYIKTNQNSGWAKAE